MSYFRPEEFLCRCGRPECDALQTMTPTFLDRLEVLRHRLAQPLVVTSGLRCAVWNQHEGGVSDSEHLTGEAADLRVETSQARWMLVLANFAHETPVFRRLGLGKGFVHVGVASRHPANVMWVY